MTEQDYERARRRLMRRDPILGAVIRKIGPCRLAARQHQDHLTALVRALIGQQLSTRAAATVFNRFTDLFDGSVPTVAGIGALGDAALRDAGLSPQKLGYIRDLCARVSDGRLELDRLDALADDEVIERLTAVTGVGKWTAEMFLIFRLQRPDVLPADDLGIARAVQKQYRLRSRPNARRILQIGEPWRPFRSIASWYLWQSLR
jgi:DNA-3-methyladenine glycosylase II